MNTTEIVVIVLGLVVGYCIVSYVLATSARAKLRAWVDQRDAPPAGRPVAPQASTPRAPAPRALLRPMAPAWHEVLGISAQASRAEIERAWRVRISQHHPDKVAQQGAEIRQLAEQRTREINAAYDEALRARRH